MDALEKAQYISKFFDIRSRETNGAIEAAFSLMERTFTVHIHGTEYVWEIDEAQCFVIGYNTRNNLTVCKLCPVCGSVA